MTVGDPEGIAMRTDPIFVQAGPQRVTAAFIKKTEGPAEDLLSPHDWTLSDRHTGMGGYGLTLLPHLRDLVVMGPRAVTGVSDNPIRERRASACSFTSFRLALLSPGSPMRPGIMTFSIAVNSGRRWWNWNTNPTVLFLNAARAYLSREKISVFS